MRDHAKAVVNKSIIIKVNKSSHLQASGELIALWIQMSRLVTLIVRFHHLFGHLYSEFRWHFYALCFAKWIISFR